MNPLYNVRDCWCFSLEFCHFLWSSLAACDNVLEFAQGIEIHVPVASPSSVANVVDAHIKTAVAGGCEG